MRHFINAIPAILFASIIFTSCFSLGGGSATVIKESVNNKGDKKAILFLRTAGATVANSYQVTVMDSHEKFDTTEVGNTFSVDTNHGQTGLNAKSINFVWLSKDTLQINFDKNLRTFIQERKVDGVTIIYQER